MAKWELMKQSEELESIRVVMFCMFSKLRFRYSMEGELKEAALRLTTSRGANGLEVDKLL